MPDSTLTPPQTETASGDVPTANLPLDLDRPADSEAMAWAKRLPSRHRPFLSLARADRPIGFWLLALPCWIGLAVARLDTGILAIDVLWFVLFGIGAIAMRGAGCTWNDIRDRDIDAKVERTAGRPIPSGQVTLNEAYGFLVLQLLIGGIVWLVLPFDAKITALLALPLVAAYPFMKRITWWPQAWLGLTFNWGVLVAFATVGSINMTAIVLFLALACWTIGYDTIYALQDREDDALIGVKSTARLFGNQAVLASYGFYLIATLLLAATLMMAGQNALGAATIIAFLAHATWQVLSMRLNRTSQNALAVFKSNLFAGSILAAGFMFAGFV